MSSRPIVEIVDYTPKSIAVFGLSSGDVTKPYKDAFLSSRGLFNPNLARGTGRAAGWIYPKKSQEQVQKLVDDINSGKIAPGTSSSETASTSSSSKYTKPSVDSIDNRAFLALVSRVEQLEQELYQIKKHCGLPAHQSNSSSSVSFPDEEDPDEEESAAPTPRLLKKKPANKG